MSEKGKFEETFGLNETAGFGPMTMSMATELYEEVQYLYVTARERRKDAAGITLNAIAAVMAKAMVDLGAEDYASWADVIVDTAIQLQTEGVEPQKA